MPLAVTHILLSVILVDIYRDYITKNKKNFTLHTVFLAGFFGLLPDIDVPIRMLATFFKAEVPSLLQHGGVTHTPLFALLFLIPAAILLKKGKQGQAAYFFVATFAIFLHLILDYFIAGGAPQGVMWLFPFSMQSWKLHIANSVGVPNITMAMDAVLLLGWLWHEEVKHKISDFI